MHVVRVCTWKYNQTGDTSHLTPGVPHPHAPHAIGRALATVTNTMIAITLLHTLHRDTTPAASPMPVAMANDGRTSSSNGIGIYIDMLLLQYHATYDKTGRWDVPVQKSPRWGCQTRNKRGARGTCRCCAALGSWGALCPGNHAEEPCTHLQPMNWPHRLEPCARATPQTKVVPAIPAQKSRSGSARRRRCPGSAPQPTHGSG